RLDEMDAAGVERLLLSAFGYGRPTTPRLARIASEGVRYARAFTPAPWTPPSHASLFTGLAMHRHGLRVGRGDRMHHGIPTLAKTLAGAGYRTVGFSSNAYISEQTGLHAGFAEFTRTYAGPEKNGPAEKTNDAEAMRAAVASWLGSPGVSRKGRAKGAGGPPLFLFLNFMDCHQPNRPPPTDVLAVKGPDVAADDLAKAAALIQPDFLQHLMGTRPFDASILRGLNARYDASALYLDRKTGEILDLLEEHGIGRDALLVMTADHGEGLGEHGLVEHRLSLYDNLLHVPLTLRRPGRFEGGKVVERAVSLMDVYPTILEEAGVPVPAGTGLDALPLPREPVREGGRTLLAEFERPVDTIEEMKRHFPSAPDPIYRFLSLSIVSVREPVDAKRPLKYLRYERWNPDGTRAGLDREELYDWVADPGETTNLLAAGDPAARAEADRLARSIPGLMERRTR
ncbi:MAG: sulfatase, partial [Planctomycetaceae bacterium]|nr:sulfatase [Planctomycetaceae bacterium]